MLDVPQYEIVMSSCRLFWLHLICFSYLVVLGSCQLQSSTMKLVSNSSEPVCAADRATTVSQAKSLIDCQRQCSTQKSKCYASNFYSDTQTCELYNFKPTTFTSSRKTCRMFANYDYSADLNQQGLPPSCSFPFTYNGVLYLGCAPTIGCLSVNRTSNTSCSTYTTTELTGVNVSFGGVSFPVQSIAGWIIWMTRRAVDNFNWNLTWSSYKNGFGSFSGSNFWLGLENVHQLTTSSKYRLRIEMKVNSLSVWYSVEYWSIIVGDEALTKYQLNVNGFSGDTLNGMQYANQPGCNYGSFPNGMKFSTSEADNDVWSSNCASLFGGGWWYNYCDYVCLTGSGSWFRWSDKTTGCSNWLILDEVRMMFKLQ